MISLRLRGVEGSLPPHSLYLACEVTDSGRLVTEPRAGLEMDDVLEWQVEPAGQPPAGTHRLLHLSLYALDEGGAEHYLGR